jgi:branched-chain amino acid transport system permease protein
VGIVMVKAFVGAGFPAFLFIIPLIFSGLLLGVTGPVIERGLMKFVYDRDEAFQLILTFALVMMIEDVIKFIWGTSPQTTGGIDLIYGRLDLFGATVPVYNLVVILCSLIIAALIGYLLLNTRFGRIIRATAEKKEMGEALGINMKMVYIKVFTLGTVLGTLGGALVIPATAVVSEMGVELIVMAFAVVVIGGLGSMKGAFIGALIVGVLKSIAISTYPELEMLTIYIIVIAVLVIKPQGLFGGSKA